MLFLNGRKCGFGRERGEGEEKKSLERSSWNVVIDNVSSEEVRQKFSLGVSDAPGRSLFLSEEEGSRL
jgi:hypothetical protein